MQLLYKVLFSCREGKHKKVPFDIQWNKETIVAGLGVGMQDLRLNVTFFKEFLLK